MKRGRIAALLQRELRDPQVLTDFLAEYNLELSDLEGYDLIEVPAVREPNMLGEGESPSLTWARQVRPQTVVAALTFIGQAIDRLTEMQHYWHAHRQGPGRRMTTMMAADTAPQLGTFGVRPSWWHARLISLTSARATAAAHVEAATAAGIIAKRALADAEHVEWLDGRLATVKPAELRAAVLRAATTDLRAMLDAADAEARQARSQLEQIEWELRAVLALGRLVGGAA